MYQFFTYPRTIVYASKLLINHSIFHLLHFRYLLQPQQPSPRHLFVHWKTLIVSLALCYYFRLPKCEENKAKKDKKERKELKESAEEEPKYDRTRFEEEMTKKLWNHTCPGELAFKKTVNAMLNAFYAETQIPGTFFIQKNLFFFFVS